MGSVYDHASFKRAYTCINPEGAIVHVSNIFYYPLKSGAIVSTSQALASSEGLAGDREFMLVDRDGIFMSQRGYPQMALITLAANKEGLTIKTPSGSITKPRQENKTMEVKVWRDWVIAYEQSSDINDLLSDFLNHSVRLVGFGHKSRRLANPKNTPGKVYHRFADGYPYLIASQESLAELNSRISQSGSSPVPMSRFRPNIEIAGWPEPFAEERVQKLKIGSLVFAFTKKCERCTVIGIDQLSGLRHPEPMKTLASYRYSKEVGGVCFGVNMCLIEGHGNRINVGDPVHILEEHH